MRLIVHSDFMLANRRRKFAPKVHGRCHTCRRRHVRCTQERPACNTCVRSFRQCIYDPSEDTAVDLSVVFWQPQSIRLARQPSPTCWDAAECRYLDFYRNSICCKLKGSFEDPFWENTVCQLAETTPPIREAITTLALVWDQASQNDCTALKHYDKAVSGTRELIESGRGSAVKEALVCNLLFICLELYQRHFESALSQIACGLYLYCTWNIEGGDTKAHLFDSNNTALALDRIYRRLMAQSALFFDNHLANWKMWTPHLILSNQAVPDSFPTIELARDCFIHLIGSMIHQSISARANGQDILDKADSLPRPLFQFQAGVLARISEPLGKYRMIHPGVSTAKEHFAVTSLEVLQLALSVLEAASKEAYPESAFDKHMATFAAIVRRSSSIIGANATNQDVDRGFSFDMEVLPPLYFVASRCRCPNTRRAAVRLLVASARQEGLWDSRMLASLANRIIAIEEDGVEVETYKDVPHSRRVALTRAVIDSQSQTITAVFNYRRTEQSDFQVLHEVVAY